MSVMKLSVIVALVSMLLLVVSVPSVEGFGGMLRRSKDHKNHDIKNSHNAATDKEDVKMMGIEQEVCDKGCPYDPKAANCSKQLFQFNHCYNVAGFNTASSSSSLLLSSEALSIASANLQLTHTQFRPYTCVDRRGGVSGGGHPLPPHFTFRYASVNSGIPPSPTSECAASANYSSPVTEMVGSCFQIPGNKFVLNRCWMDEKV